MTDPAGDFASETVATIAGRVRKAVLRARDPQFAAAYDAMHEAPQLKIANAELGQDFLTRPGHMILNSTWKYVWIPLWRSSVSFHIESTRADLIGRRRTLASPGRRAFSIPCSMDLDLSKFSAQIQHWPKTDHGRIAQKMQKSHFLLPQRLETASKNSSSKK